MLLRYVFVICFCISQLGLLGQVVISDDSTAVADPSAALDINITGTTKKGVLMPRVTQAQRLAIASPAEGLMVVQTDETPGLYLYIQGAWRYINLNSSTPVFINGISPAVGVSGELITITGGGFDPIPANNTVTFPGSVVGTVTAATTTSLTVQVPYTRDGNVLVTLGGVPFPTPAFDYREPVITGISPNPQRAGQPVTITGTDFDPSTAQNQVRFNGTLGTVTLASPTSLTVTVPLTGTDGNVTNEIGLNTSAGVAFTYTKPVIASITPNPAPFNTSVTLAGTGFNSTAGNNTVRFNGTAATVTAAATDGTSLSVTVPSALDGNVTVQVGNYTSPGVAFTYSKPTLASISPTAGIEGQTITLTGTNFDPTPANNTVRFNGVTLPVVTATTTELTVVLTETVTDGNVTVRVGQYTTAETVPFDYLEPTITSFTPTTGGTGTVVTVTGTNFDPVAANNQVSVNGVLGFAISASATEIQFLVPSYQTGALSVRRVPDNRTVAGSSFTYTDVSVITYAGNGFRNNVDNSDPLSAQFAEPVGVAADASSNTYTTEVLGTTPVRRIDTGPGAVTTIAGTGYGFDNGDALSMARFAAPRDLTLDGSGRILVADGDNNLVRRIAFGATSDTVGTLAGSGTFGFLDGSGASARFSNPTGVAVDVSGNVFVADQGNHRIRRIDAATGVVSTWAGSGTPGFADGPAATAQFNSPFDVTVDASGNVYVADVINNRIRRIDPTGTTVTTLAGSGGFGSADGVGTAAQFGSPVSLALSADGSRLYVADQGNHRIRVVQTASGIVSTVAGTGSSGFVNGAGAVARFSSPRGIAVLPDGRLVVADSLNNVIRLITF